MFGAIIGDIAGSYYETSNIKTKKFKIMETRKSSYTDDTVMTLAVAKSFLYYIWFNKMVVAYKKTYKKTYKVI